jgi:hypothetical protein
MAKGNFRIEDLYEYGWLPLGKNRVGTELGLGLGLDIKKLA